MSYIVKTFPGLEKITAREVQGRVLTIGTIETDIEPKNARTITIVYKKETACSFTSMDDLAEALKTMLQPRKGKVGVRCSRVGEHSFRSADVTAMISQILRERGQDVDYKHPDTIVYCDIVQKRCFIGELLQEDVHKRPYRIKHNNKSINACIAAAMVLLANPGDEEAILDPFCKDGIIALEAWMMGKKKVYAVDWVKNNVRNAAINCKFAKTTILPEVCSEVVDYAKEKKIQHIITHLPISRKKKSDEANVKRDVQRIAEIAQKTLTISTTYAQPIKDVLKESWLLKEECLVSVGDMTYTLLQYQSTRAK